MRIIHTIFGLFQPRPSGVLAAICALATCGAAQAQPALSLHLADGTPQLSLTGATGVVCRIQYLDDTVTGTNWHCLTSLAVADNPCIILDTNASVTAQRCYRALAVCPDLALIPGDSFAMGDAFGDLGADEVPVHTATVSGFYMDRTEVSKALWDIVYSWATNHGYDFSVNAGLAKGITHPATAMNWHDAVKWCNARSQLEGLTPCYHTNDSQTGVYCTGQFTIGNSFVNWSANGYRLPTEAEWERAARGGASGMRFPWSDTNVISHTRANYYAGNYYAYDQSPTIGYHPAFTNAPFPYTSPCGYFAANGFGLCDLAGNVWEWCWDWHDAYWYTNAAALQADPHGPLAGTKRVGRGGSYSSNAPDNCCALREGVTPTAVSTDRGFRCVRRATSTNLVIIPVGAFQMGDTFSEGSTNELPLHTVSVNAFYIERHEVTKDLWDSVYTWATNHSYEFDNVGLGKAADHPVHTINWFDAVKWCNARSEMEGLTPAYYLDTSLSNIYIYRGAGQAALWTNFVKWNANGYRLPTEAEWEKAARGGAGGQRFPWGDTITHTQANYYSTTDFAYDISGTRNYHPGYNTNGFPYTNPIDAFAPNPYGLYGMADNICEWCWDWFDPGWYGKAAATQNNTRGPRGDGMTYRVLRGGSWNLYANKGRCAYRPYNGPASAVFYFGFRCVRGL